jgi:hypothetical protein
MRISAFDPAPPAVLRVDPGCAHRQCRARALDLDLDLRERLTGVEHPPRDASRAGVRGQSIDRVADQLAAGQRARFTVALVEGQELVRFAIQADDASLLADQDQAARESLEQPPRTGTPMLRGGAVGVSRLGGHPGPKP